MLIIEKQMPNGSICNYHTALFEGLGQDNEGQPCYLARVTSFPREEMDMPGWQDVYTFPLVFGIHTVEDVENALALPGAPFDGAAVIDPANSDLILAKAKKRAEITATRKRLVNEGCPVEGVGTFYGDTESRADLIGAVMWATIAKANEDPYAENFKLMGDVVLTFDADGIIAAGLAVGQWYAGLHAHSQAKDAEVEAAVTIEEVMAVSWGAVEP